MDQQQESDDTRITIPFVRIASYFGGCNTRSIRAGEEIVDAGWVHSIGFPSAMLTSNGAPNLIIGYVVRASSMLSSPYEVRLRNLLNHVSSWVCICSCIAGEGRNCKHIAACLIYIYRNPVLHIISCTEVKQKWGKIGKTLSAKYIAVCAADMCHTRKKVCMRNECVMKVEQDEFMKSLLKGNNVK